jgi:hypothetical protein
MATSDRRFDAHIAKSAGFARPIPSELRQQVHRGCPAAVEIRAAYKAPLRIPVRVTWQ